MAKKQNKQKDFADTQTQTSQVVKKDMTMPIVGLCLNVLVLPGLGSIIGGKTKVGTTQLILAIIAIPLCFILIGIPLFFGVWIWGLVSGIQLIQEAQN